MRGEVSTPGQASRRRPGRVFRKWVLIGAVAGAVLAGIGGAMIVGLIMFVGALVGAAVGAVVGVVQAGIAAVNRG